MKAKRLLLCVLALALTLVASLASANPYPPCDEVCTPDSPCTTRCSVWCENNTYQNVTCSYAELCSF